ncbi:MAG: NUDIX domain-containing protein [Kofleriaceae bacterium]
MLDAAAVIVLRRGRSRGYHVLLVRRRRAASFMASACVFPGGGVDPGDVVGDLRSTAARELLEEAGVLLASPRLPATAVAAVRARQRGGAALAELLAEHGGALDLDALAPWAHWVTPSGPIGDDRAGLGAPPAKAPKRFSARFFVAECPPEQLATCDDDETVEHLWVTPAEGVVRARELALPPPQLRTLWELMALPTVDDVLAAARARAGVIAPILPRVAAAIAAPAVALASAPVAVPAACLLLPWDPDYLQGGLGDALPLPTPPPPWAVGKSRFVLTDGAWHHEVAPPPA